MNWDLLTKNKSIQGGIMESNNRFSVGALNWKKLAIHAGLIGLSAILVFLIEYFSKIDLGVYTPVVMAVITFLSELVQKYISKY